MDVLQEVLAAEERIGVYVKETPLRRAAGLSEAIQGTVWLKLENQQLTGSFKVRGALSKLLACSPEERRKGIVTASTGNHGLAVAYALRTLGLRGSIYLPETASEHKIALLRQAGADLVFYGQDGVEAEREARRLCCEKDCVYVSPYNDPAVIGGQGTVATEVLRHLPNVDAVLLSVGGGGLMAGIAGFIATRSPATDVVGCSPRASAVMHASVHAGYIVSDPVLPTLSDGTAGGIEEGAITYEVCRRLVTDWLVVGETAIAAAMRRVYEEEGLVIEGAAGVAVASLLQARERFKGKIVVVVVCGGNVALDRFLSIIN